MRKKDTNKSPKVVFEDDSLLAVNKPSGWIVNRAVSAKNQPILQDWIEQNFDFEIAKDEELRNGIVHRLDKETSGVLLVAKNKQVFEALQNLFAKREVKKTYRALVHKKFQEPQVAVDKPVGRLPWRRDRFGVLPQGREATTKFVLIKNYKNKQGSSQFSLINAFPKTGRTHQIRVHLKHLGHPVVADTFYAGRKTARADRQWCPRLFLHASSISFTHPTTGKEKTISAPLSQDLKRALATLFTIS